MKTTWIRMTHCLMVAVFLLLVPACSTPTTEKKRRRPVVKAAKVSATATVESAKATGKAVKNTTAAVIGK